MDTKFISNDSYGKDFVIFDSPLPVAFDWMKYFNLNNSFSVNTEGKNIRPVSKTSREQEVREFYQSPELLKCGFVICIYVQYNYKANEITFNILKYFNSINILNSKIKIFKKIKHNILLHN